MPFDPAAMGWKPFDDPALPQVMTRHWEREEGEGFAYGFETGAGQANGLGVVHGGILATYIDHTMGRVARRAAGDVPVATIQLDLHYLSPARPGFFIEARGIVVRRTMSVIFLRGALTSQGTDVLTASGIWKILGRR
ncbi:PaaI family thioesterase [Falsiroseomonas bella]|nr:PaaI family thioesterase [Falsiroseomonas bella]